MAATTTFNPKNTTINEDKLSGWLQDKVTGDLEELPGIGPANKKKLEEAGINNTYQIIGQYLLLKNGSIQDHQDAMYMWLKSVGVNSGRNNVILALAEKLDILIEGVYDASLYE
mmetsp:Transcript_11894/g.14370  ORF Transcript_11894/g.14370 Transcript_11894/m.14370 type:complete len:114 (-) Transcript_11894:168-509(-)